MDVVAADREDVRIARVSGEIDLSNARAVLEAIGDAVRSGATSIVVDLSGVTFLDSSGIAMLFRLQQRIAYSRQELRLVVPRGSTVRRVLELARVPDLIPIQDTLDG
ncbi:STAS domain-containing protein [Nocardioides jejuensis]|uniref:STAS domain-containing protein n=1 Tax=Nocardioides jejuensis TaxID=2502782 RepID=UPI0014049DEE|nr:STAS domain-containing protein [Nocardioides jejuensis]